jgi:hypothetical protein
VEKKLKRSLVIFSRFASFGWAVTCRSLAESLPLIFGFSMLGRNEREVFLGLKLAVFYHTIVMYSSLKCLDTLSYHHTKSIYNPARSLTMQLP